MIFSYLAKGTPYKFIQFAKFQIFNLSKGTIYICIYIYIYIYIINIQTFKAYSSFPLAFKRSNFQIRKINIFEHSSLQSLSNSRIQTFKVVELWRGFQTSQFCHFGHWQFEDPRNTFYVLLASDSKASTYSEYLIMGCCFRFDKYIIQECFANDWQYPTYASPTHCFLMMRNLYPFFKTEMLESPHLQFACVKTDHYFVDGIEAARRAARRWLCCYIESQYYTSLLNII